MNAPFFPDKAFLPYARQTVTEADIAAVVAVLRGQNLTQGPAVVRLEAALKQATQAPYAIAVANGTAALHLAMLALGLKPGDAAIVPAVTFAATANAARYCGAEPVFADVDPDSGLMTREALEAAIGRARAMGLEPRVALPVHLGGQMVDIDALADVAALHGIALVEDACHALGGSVADGPVGAATRSAMAVFSFHPAKIATSGEGGALTTRDPELARRLATLRTHGIVKDPAGFADIAQAFGPDGLPNPWYYEQQALGFNYRLSDIHAALGAAQIARLPELVQARMTLMARYEALLGPLAPIVRPVTRCWHGMPAWHLMQVLIDFPALGRSRAETMRALAAGGIGTQVHYIPLYRLPDYAGRRGVETLPGAESFYARTLSLPLYPGMTPRDVERVMDALAALLPA